ncbi:MAG: hypothetical protein FJ088_05510 [Deltaproteobacteria bacterium]|nr:hypothetical protein [Deltaproteobacteria bacterium]
MKKIYGKIIPGAIFLALALSCGQKIGDDCSGGSDCGTGRICDKSQPGGYCTISPCEKNSCPDEAVCIFFTDFDSYCMLRCDTDDDCRDEYRCVTGFGDHPFCNQK